MKLIIAYGSKGKFFHMKEFGDALLKLKIEYRLVRDVDYCRGFPSKNINDWFFGKRALRKLIRDFQPDMVFTDRQTHFALECINNKIPTFILLRGQYWSEQEWAKKTIYKNPFRRFVLILRNRISEKCFEKATAIFPICDYLVNIIKEYHPNQNTHVFFEGIEGKRWFITNQNKLKHPCIGLVQDPNWWGKTKEMLILKNVLIKFPNVTFYWAGDGPYRNKIISELSEFKNFVWLGRLNYPNEVRDFLSEIDIYALITGMDLAPLTLKEAQLMKKPVIATNVGGVKEMMIDKKTGFLVTENSDKQIIEKIEFLLNNNNESKKMGEEGKKFVEETFNWDIIAEKFLKNIKTYL